MENIKTIVVRGMEWRKWKLDNGAIDWDQVDPVSGVVGGWPSVDAGGGRKWSGNDTLGWIEAPNDVDASRCLLIVRGDATIRRLTPEEIERAERGEGPAGAPR